MIEFRATLTRGDFTLDAAFRSEAKITALFGPSGSGKTTVLHMIAGLIKPSQGRIRIADRVLLDTTKGIAVPSHRRRVGLVYQDAQLFPHLTVAQNIAFGRWFAAADRRGIEQAAVVGALGIEALLQRRPTGLSGGEKQRVALAR
jgi:molybdate transport system ATP-binding protein